MNHFVLVIFCFMAVFCSRQRVAIFLHSLILWHVCFALGIESPSGFSQYEGWNSVGKRAEGTKTFEIPFNITIIYGEIYGFNCSIGTPPQNVTLGIEVFRSDSLVSMNITKNPWSTAYNTTLSTSANHFLEWVVIISSSIGEFDFDNDFNLYDISYASVYYATDSFTISSASNKMATIDGMQFVAYGNMTYDEPKLNRGLLKGYDYNFIGLGLPSGQSITQLDIEPVFGRPYPTFAQHFINENLIESNTYSIWLDPVANQTGHLLLGGINSFRYKDSLISLPTVLNYTSDLYGLKFQTVMACSIESLSFGNTPLPASNISHVVLAHSLDTLLEASVAKAVWDAVGATYDKTRYPPEAITPNVPCSYLTNSTTIDIKFSGANITRSVLCHIVSGQLSLTARGGQGALGDSGRGLDTCILRIKAAGYRFPSMLGTGFMRNLYTVYDLEGGVLSVALTDFEAAERGDDNVITIPKGGVAAIPKIAFKNRPSAITEGGASNTTSPGSQDIQGKSKNGVAIGVGVAVPLVAIIAFAAAFFLFRRRRKARKHEAVSKTEGNDETQSSKGQLADDQRLKGEILRNSVHEISGKENSSVHELPVGAKQHELA